MKPVPTPLTDELDDQQVRDQVASRIRQLDGVGRVRSIRTGALHYHVFSIVFRVWAETDAGVREWIVKIPKDDLRTRVRRILPLETADRRLAADEYASLQALRVAWPDTGLGVAFVTPIAFIEPFNALVTEFSSGEDGCDVFRRWDARRRLGDQRSAARMRAVMSRFGRSLRLFHDATAVPATCEGRLISQKLTRYAAAIRTHEGNQAVLADVDAEASRWRTRAWPAVTSMTLKGIDLRNFLINADDHVVILDPGRRKSTWPAADLARFLLTYRLLWWGSGAFLAGWQPDRAAEAAFLDAYGRPHDQAHPLFRLQLVKEILKHWLTFLDSLSLKPWPAMAKRTLARGWINRYFTAQLRTELAALSEWREESVS